MAKLQELSKAEPTESLDYSRSKNGLIIVSNRSLSDDGPNQDTSTVSKRKFRIREHLPGLFQTPP
jgi:hypothetical protein